MQNGLVRQWRVKLLPLLAAFLAVKYLLLAAFTVWSVAFILLGASFCLVAGCIWALT